MATMDRPTRASPLERRIRKLFPNERRDEADAFIRRYHLEHDLPEKACRARLAEVRRALRKDGTYRHTPGELAFGARLAWRNHARCIGRLYWESLEVIDARHVTDPDEIAAMTIDHLTNAFNGGRIRSMITVFAPAAPGSMPLTIESPQLTQYAGYHGSNGERLGDPQSIELTRVVSSLGWEGRRTNFDILPIVVRQPDGGRILYEVPEHAVREVPITHPEIEGFASLGLRWYAVPVVSDMIMTIGGIEYPCAPFNGFYMGTEIASRNFADDHRYAVLPTVARLMGDDPASSNELWRDRALTELNRAVLHSFEKEGVTMIDHHRASRQYMLFAQRERAAGRRPSGDWMWIVPPQASAACPVFHTGMVDRRIVPNFYRSRASDGRHLKADRSHQDRTRLELRLERVRRRVNRWRHERADR